MEKSKRNDWIDQVLSNKWLMNIFRIHMGAAIIRIWGVKVIPRETNVHLFEYLRWKRVKTDKPLMKWLREQEVKTQKG